MSDPRLGSLVPARPFFRCLGAGGTCANIPTMTIAMRGQGRTSRYSCVEHQQFWTQYLTYVCSCCTQDVPPRVVPMTVAIETQVRKR